MTKYARRPMKSELMGCDNLQSIVLNGEPGGVTSTVTGSNQSRRRRAIMAKRKSTGLARPRHLSLAEVIERGSIPEPNSGCHLWMMSIQPSGYGQFGWKGRVVLAHRAAYEAANGPIPAGMFVCHKCDVPSCVNAEHLFLGSAADNTADAHRKGRLAFGSRNGQARLSEEQVETIRASPLSGRKLARIFGVSAEITCGIRGERRWVSKR